MGTSDRHSQVFGTVNEYVSSNIDAQEALKLDLDQLRILILDLVGKASREQVLLLNTREQQAVSSEILDDMVRLGPLQPLMDDPEISDIMVNGPDQVYIERRGKLELSPVTFRDNAHVLNMAQRIANSVSRRVDESSPMVDARLHDGSRVNIIISPLSLTGPCISIRKFVQKNMALSHLVATDSMSAAMADFLALGVKARFNILISGGTGAGKTTLLNALSAHIGNHERVVTIEDAAELKLSQSHVINLETRDAGVEGTGQVTQRDLLRNTLRMRPERIIIGECRGEETFDMLQAMSTGHDGSLSTLHASSPAHAVDRLEDMLSMGAKGMDRVHMAHQLATSVEWLVQIERGADGHRRVTDICEIHFEDSRAVPRPIFQYQIKGRGGRFVQVNRATKGDSKCKKYAVASDMARFFAS